VRRLVAAIFAGFAVLMAATFYVAGRSGDGLVERNYYESATNEFTDREEEARAGLSMTVPDRYLAGESRFAVALTTAAGPLRGARATLIAMRTSGTEEDRSFTLREESPGNYAADILLPFPGQWMLSLAVDAGRIRARRRWTVEASPAAGPSASPLPPGAFRAHAGSQEVRLSVSPWPPRPMRDLSFAVELPGYTGGATPHVELSMPGMEMGRNRFPLSRGADGFFRGTGVIVRCASGRKDWEAAVTVPGGGKAVFRIDVAD